MTEFFRVMAAGLLTVSGADWLPTVQMACWIGVVKKGVEFDDTVINWNSECPSEVAGDVVLHGAKVISIGEKAGLNSFRDRRLLSGTPSQRHQDE